MTISELHDAGKDLNRLSAFVQEHDSLLPDPLSAHVDITTYCLKLMTLGRVFIAEDNQQICGLCMGYINDIINGIAHLQVLLVQASRQHQGIGKLLVNSFISAARHAGMKEIQLTYDKKNKNAELFYKRIGFIQSMIEHPNSQKKFLIYPL